jgi:hypothetical protein
MRPWMIVLSSAFVALLVVATMAVPEVIGAPRAEIAPILQLHSPALVVAALAVYGLCAILLTTVTLVSEILRLRHHLVQTAADPTSAWGAAFVSGLRRLSPRLTAALTQSATATDGVAFGVRPTASETRGEFARLYYVSLARCHFLSALIVLAGIAALGLAHDHASLPLQTGVIPTASVMMIIAGLMLLGILGRIAVDVTAEPLLEVISQLPTVPVEVGLLRRVVELLESTRDRPRANEAVPAPLPAEIPEWLVASIEQSHHALLESIEQGHHVLLDAVSRFAASAGALENTTRMSIEMLETTFRAAAAQQQPAEEGKFAGAPGFSELQTAVQELTAVLQRLSVKPEGAEDMAVAEDRAPRPHRGSGPHVARELRQLLQEIEGAR